MKIQRTSILSGETNVLDLDITEEQLKRWTDGAYAQDVFPHLSANDREFLLSGITPGEWDKAFK